MDLVLNPYNFKDVPKYLFAFTIVVYEKIEFHENFLIDNHSKTVVSKGVISSKLYGFSGP